MHCEEYYELTEKTGWRVTDFDWDQLVKGFSFDMDLLGKLAQLVSQKMAQAPAPAAERPQA